MIISTIYLGFWAGRMRSFRILLGWFGNGFQNWFR
jgi:hypothetical protein